MNPSSTECEGSSNRHYTSEIDDNFSELTKTTISKIKRRYRTNRSDNEDVKSKFYDTTSPSYGWLLPGWVGEERLMIKTRRVYKVISILFSLSIH